MLERQFAVLSADTNEVLVGHHTARHGLKIDAATSLPLALGFGQCPGPDEIEIPGLSGEVKVVTDAHGVWHIEADDDFDLAIAGEDGVLLGAIFAGAVVEEEEHSVAGREPSAS